MATYGDPSSTAGPVWNPGAPLSAPIRTDVLQATAASPAPAGDGGLCGFDWGQVQYGEWTSDDPNYGIPQDGNFVGSPAVWTPQVRAGYFWMIFGLSFSYNDGNARAFAHFLMPSSFATPRPPTISGGSASEIFLGQSLGAGKAFDSVPKVGVRIQGSFVQSVISPGTHASLLTPALLIVPPRWAILTCRDDNQVGAADKATLRVQAAYAELQIGSDAPGFGS
jgi:hypothetical protein